MNTVNRLLGLVLGLALLAVGLLAAAETVLALLERPPWLVDYEQLTAALAQRTWDDGTVVAAAVLTVFAGALLVVVQLLPGRPGALRLAEEGPNRLAALDGRGLQELLRRCAVDDGDVLDADVRVRRRSVRVSGRVPHDAQPRTVASRTRERVQGRVDELGLQRPLKVRVHMQRSKVRVR